MVGIYAQRKLVLVQHVLKTRAYMIHVEATFAETTDAALMPAKPMRVPLMPVERTHVSARCVELTYVPLTRALETFAL